MPVHDQNNNSSAARPGKPIRISVDEREMAITRLQDSFVQGRLTDAELGERVANVLRAKTVADLDVVLCDLPEEPSRELQTGGSAAGTGVILAYRSNTERTGMWRVPRNVRLEVFRGHMLIDLRTAQLSHSVTDFEVSAHKGTLEIIVNPAVNVEAQVSVYKGEWINTVEPEMGTTGSPVIRIHGSGYKSKVVVRKAPMPSAT